MNVSVVIIAHNSEKTIGTTISSLIDQTYPKDKIEIVIVDDSNDTTERIVKELLNNKGYNYKYIKIEPCNIPQARNMGINKSSGSIIFFIDSDCVAECEWIQKHIEVYRSYNVDAVGGSVRITSKSFWGFVDELYSFYDVIPSTVNAPKERRYIYILLRQT